MNTALGDPLSGSEPKQSWSRAYLRLVAVIFLVIGLLRAAAIIGLTPDERNILDMAPAWRAGIVALVALDLFAAVGLWLAAAWGPVIWAVAAIVEIAMYTFLADQFGTHYLRLLGHIVLLAIYLALAIREWRLDSRG